MTDSDIEGVYASFAELYDHVVPYQNRPDVGFFVEAAIQAGGEVLEVGCGTGRVLIPTALAGVEITGLDLSPQMLAVCRERLKAEAKDVRARVRLVKGDMRHFALQQKFKLVTLPFRPFQHLTTVEDQLACMECIHQHLKKGGKIILDLFNPSLKALANQPTGEELDEEPEFSMPDGRRVTRRHMVAARDLFNQIIHTELVYYITHPDGRKERMVQAFPMRYFFKFEAEHLLARAGFKVEQVYADYDKSLYGSKYPGELIFVARKP